MLRVDLTAAKPGMRLAMPVVHSQYPKRVLLCMGYAIEARSIKRLIKLGVRWLWVQCPSLDYLGQFVDQKVLNAQAQVVEQITETFQSLQRHATAKLPYHEYCRSVGQLVNNLVGNPKAALFLGEIFGSGCGDLMRHSSTVTYLSLLMGLRLEGYLVRQRRHIDPVRAAEVTNLGIGAMLHDVGVTALPEAVVERYTCNGDDSDPEWRKHPALGYERVRGSIEPTAANVVLHHHQRFDGSGYGGTEGQAIDGTRIHVFTRIVGLAEQFDRICHPPGLPAQPMVWALASLLQEEMVRKFDPEVMRALFAIAPPYPPGSIVRLSDGRWAVVLDHYPHNPCRPIVQTMRDPQSLQEGDAPTGPPIDLTLQSPRLFVAEADGLDVSQANFVPPPFMVEEARMALRA